ncbi:MAG: endonuclease [bacterium]|nr:endonuclease [bacterium]
MKKFTLVFAFFLFQLTLFAQTSLPAFWTFISPSPSEDSTNAPLGWKTRLNIVVGGTTPYSYATGSDGNAACRLDGQGEYVQINFAETPGKLSYYIRGTAINPNPPFSGSFKIQESIDGVSWTDLRNYISMTTGFAKFTENPSANSRFVRFFYQTKVSGSNVALDSVFLGKPGLGNNAKLAVKFGNASLVNGGTQIIGNVATSKFLLQNEALQQTLYFSSISLSGLNSTAFTLGNLPDSILPGDTFGLYLNLNLSSSGSKFATLTLNSNSIENASFGLNLYGIAGALASEPQAQATQLSYTNVSAYGFTVSYTKASPEPEYYLVLRKETDLITEEPIDGQSYKKGDFIGSAKVAYVGSASAFNANHVLANSTYRVAVFAFNGPAGYENYLSSNPLKGTVYSNASNPGSYYAGISPNNPNFVSQLSARVHPHDTVFYGNYSAALVNPWLARDTLNGRKVVTCVYTNHQFVYNEPFLWANGSNGAVLTREHTWPQSWMPSNSGNPDWPNAPGTTKEMLEYNDLHNLFPAHQVNANARRSNNPFDEVVTPTYTAPTGFGMLGKDSANRTAYEPRPEQKGDVARALFYMAISYNGINGLSWAIPSNQNLALLRQWHQQDPPDNFERTRNEVIGNVQGNRNPFIDHPEWANRINFRNMTYIADTAPASIKLLRPLASDIWVKGKPASISWEHAGIDSVELLFSEDSLKTFTSLGKYASSLDSIQYNADKVFSHFYGVIIARGYSPGFAFDTSTYFKLSMVDGFNKLNNKINHFNVYPNPFNDKLNFEYLGSGIPEFQYKIYNTMGMVIYEGEARKYSEIDTKQLSPGLYYFYVNGQENHMLFKLIKP